MIISTLASAVAHVPAFGVLSTLPLVGAGAVLWAGDFVSSPLLLGPITGERPIPLIIAVGKDAGPVEGAQYMVGLLGAIAAQHALWSVFLVALPTVFVYQSFKSAKDIHETLRQLWPAWSRPLPKAILVLDVEGRIMIANRQTAAIYGHPDPESMRGLSLTETVSEVDQSRLAEDLQETLRRGMVTDLEYQACRRNGESFVAELSYSLIADKRGRPRAVTCTARDVTRRAEEARELLHRALYDALTGVPNRVLFQDRLEQACTRTQREGQAFAVMLMDLNRFKQANDTFGHQCGDLVLQETARRLRTVLRDSDSVARLGGDEFALLLPKADAGGAAIVADRIQEAMAEPFLFEGQDLAIGASLGIAVWDVDGNDPAQLLHEADRAMYASKRTGDRYAFAEALRCESIEETRALAS